MGKIVNFEPYDSIFTYNKDGKLILLKYKKLYAADSIKKYFYKEDGRIDHRLDFTGREEFSWKVIYAYDGNRNVLKEKAYDEENKLMHVLTYY